MTTSAIVKSTNNNRGRSIRLDFPDVSKSRHVKDSVRLQVVAATAGRCQFLGCNTSLFVHPVTKRGGVWGEVAHIHAHSPNGPRGKFNLDVSYLNSIENLMLLCPTCHKEVDINKERYPVEALMKRKRDHEADIQFKCSFGKKDEVAIIKISSDLLVATRTISDDQLLDALDPLYPAREHIYNIDLAMAGKDSSAAIALAKTRIDSTCFRIFHNDPTERPQRIAIFGIADISILAYLGSKIGDQCEALLFQNHRITKSWKWGVSGEVAKFETRLVQEGQDLSRVAIMLSISGVVKREQLPLTIDESFYVYELSVSGTEPATGVLKTKEDLVAFREMYRDLCSQIRNQHHSDHLRVAMFPAVPASAAVAIGMDRLPKVDGPMDIYDCDRSRPGRNSWKFAMTINEINLEAK